jgi:hypothetical protein
MIFTEQPVSVIKHLFRKPVLFVIFSMAMMISA